MKSKKSKELQEAEDDLLFYLKFYKKFPKNYQKRIADKEIEELEREIKESN